MKIHQMHLSSYRNISEMKLSFCDTANIICGTNGQGKTNLLEGMWMFTGERSFRGSSDQKLIQFEKSKALVQMEFTAKQREQHARMEIEQKRVFWRNDVKLKSPGELSGQFCAVLFSPAQLSLVREGPAEKRKFLDISISQLRPRYKEIISNYKRCLEQRNQLLKQSKEQEDFIQMLPVWEKKLAEIGAVIIKTRATFVEKLKPFAQMIYEDLSGGRERFTIEYHPGAEIRTKWDIPSIEQKICEIFEERRLKDIQSGVTGIGPHRDDIGLYLNGKSAREYGSQGQQRSCVLAMKLAEGRLMEEVLEEPPIIMLDDVMSELDEMRREYLLNHLGERQLILTCCDASYFKRLREGKVFYLENNRVREEFIK